MACKDKCCCPVKRRPAKKRKATVGKVSATQLLAQSIASLALPRRVNEPFLYGNSPLGEAQRNAPIQAPIVGPAVAVAPNAPLPPIAKPAKYSRNQIKVSTLAKEPVMNEPVGRYDLPRVVKGGEIRPSVKTLPVGDKPYEPMLGVNIPVRKEGQFIKKESGLFEPETRGATTLEQRRALPPGQKRLTDFFGNNF